jgi:CBS domain-containing protein
MICPCCGHVNLPGNEECEGCWQSLTALDRPMASNRVERSLMEDAVGVLHPKKPIAIRPTTPLQSALQAMLAAEVGALLVTDDDGKVVGILSERDLLTKVAGLHEPFGHLPTGDFMTPKPEAVEVSDTLDFALHKMDAGGYRHLPVLKAGKPVGMISVRDMLAHIANLCKASAT